jgi:ankyrin repeat protein
MHDLFQVYLFDSVIKGDEISLNHYISLGADINCKDKNGITLLHLSSTSSESEKLIPYILEKGSNLDSIDNKGVTPLHMMCANNRLYGVLCLLHNGANPNLKTFDESKSTCLNFAIAYNNTEIENLLLSFGAKRI